MRHLLVMAVVASAVVSVAHAQDAARGKTAFSAACATCHGASLQGTQFGPAVTGAAFKAEWANQPPDALATYLQTKMPPSQPGSLPGQTYADIDVFLRQSSGLPVAAG